MWTPLGMENVSAVRTFTLLGINGTPAYRAGIFSLALLCYCLILFFNISLMAVVASTHKLHEPMYVLLCSLFVNGLYGTTGFYPVFLSNLLRSSTKISYRGCLLQAFVMYSYACSELSILAVISYDRYLAICYPLHYHAIMTKRRLSKLVSFSWLMPLGIFSVNVILTSRLALCGSRVDRLFCVNWVIVELACSRDETLPNGVIAYATICVYVSHGFFVIWTYVHVIGRCVRSVEDRAKFMQTCVPHIFSLATFLVVIVFDLMYMRFGVLDLPQNLQNFISMEFLLFPPLMNPLIYGYKLMEIRRIILSLVSGKRT